MVNLQLSDQAVNKLRAFSKILDVILEPEEVPKSDSQRAEFVISIGLDHMLKDVLPKEEILLNTMTEMFNRNPEFVCEFVADMIKKGGEEKAFEPRKLWRLYR